MTKDKEVVNDELVTDDVNTDEVSTDESAVEEEQPKVEDELVELKQQIGEYKDKYLRLFAEFDNYKKRTSREILDIRLTASKEMMVAMLPVLDDFQRAKQASDSGAESERFSEGVNLIFNKFSHILESKGLKPMETNGEPFNAEVHEAITEIPAPNEDLKGKIIDTIEKGYTLNDKIIRFPKVVVGK